jgi:hypothetical protein
MRRRIKKKSGFIIIIFFFFFCQANQLYILRSLVVERAICAFGKLMRFLDSSTKGKLTYYFKHNQIIWIYTENARFLFNYRLLYKTLDIRGQSIHTLQSLLY